MIPLRGPMVVDWIAAVERPPSVSAETDDSVAPEVLGVLSIDGPVASAHAFTEGPLRPFGRCSRSLR